MAGWTGKKSNVIFTKPEEPSFLKSFKERVGYKEDDGLSDKFKRMPKATDQDLEDGDDELPQVVQLSPEDISQEEYERILKGKEDDVVSCEDEPEKKDDVSSEEKILFRKPESSNGKTELRMSTKRPKDGRDDEGEEEKKKGKRKKGEKQNRKLLSFDDDDEDGGDST